MKYVAGINKEDNNMTYIAQNIVDKYAMDGTYIAALVDAKKQAIATKRNYDIQTSYFLFDDNSRLRICDVDQSMRCIHKPKNRGYKK